MRLKTREFLEGIWNRKLRGTDHLWDTQEDFFYWAEHQCVEVDSSAQKTFLTKIDYRMPLGPSNARVVNILQPSDWNRVIDGALCLEEDYAH